MNKYLFIIIAMVCVLGVFNQNANAQDVDYTQTILSAEESCHRAKHFDLDECIKQTRTLNTSALEQSYEELCKRWAEEAPKKVERCNRDDKQYTEFLNFRKSYTHVLANPNRLVCSKEKWFRETINAVIDKKSYFPHIKSRACKVIESELRAKVLSTSQDGLVVEINYLNYGHMIHKGFTAAEYMLTRDEYEKLKKQREAQKW